jgi:hypothetical protein
VCYVFVLLLVPVLFHVFFLTLLWDLCLCLSFVPGWHDPCPTHYPLVFVL